MLLYSHTNFKIYLQVLLDGAEDSGTHLDKIVITDKMVSSCKAARMRYKICLEEMKKEEDKSTAEKRKCSVKEELISRDKKKRRLEGTAERLIKEADALAKKAQELRDFEKLSESNDLRDKVKKLNEDISEEKQMSELKKKLQSN